MARKIRKERVVKLSQTMYEITEVNKQRALANVKRGGFCCPGCASDSPGEHSVWCCAAIVAKAHGTDLTDLKKMVALWSSLHKALSALLHPDSFDDVSGARGIPKDMKYVKLTITADEARDAAKLLARMGVVRD